MKQALSNKGKNFVKSENFVAYVIKAMEEDTGVRAALRLADNENAEYRSWGVLSRWADLERAREVKAYALIGASLARSRIKQDGELGLGKAFRKAYPDFDPTSNDKGGPALARLRRLLACQDSQELIRVLRPCLGLLTSREVPISHARLLDEILSFDMDWKREKTRAKWGNDFFRIETQDKDKK